MILVVARPVTREQLAEMLSALGTEIKVAADVELETLAGGGELHADCEEKLLREGSRQDHVWGAAWNAESGEVTFWSVINYRPHAGMRSPDIANNVLRARVARIVRGLPEGA